MWWTWHPFCDLPCCYTEDFLGYAVVRRQFQWSVPISIEEED